MKKVNREKEKKEAARKRAHKARLAKKVKSGRATKEEEEELAAMGGERAPAQERPAAGVTVVSPTAADRSLVDGGDWDPSGASVGETPDSAQSSSEESSELPSAEASTDSSSEQGLPPALSEDQISPTSPSSPPSEVTPEEKERGAQMIGVAVGLVVSSSIESAKRLAMHNKLPAALAPLVMSCGPARAAAISAVVTAAVTNCMVKYAGGAIRYTDEVIVVAALAGCAAVQVAASKLPAETDAERAQRAHVEAEVVRAEAEARAAMGARQ